MRRSVQARQTRLRVSHFPQHYHCRSIVWVLLGVAGFWPGAEPVALAAQAETTAVDAGGTDRKGTPTSAMTQPRGLVTRGSLEASGAAQPDCARCRV